MQPLKVLETDRLILRWMSLDDGEFMFKLLNDPSWLRFISAKGAKTVDDAREYIVTKIIPMYERLGFGLYLTELKIDGTPIGICGLIKRDALEDVDIGFAFLPAFRGNGYAFESASATLDYGRSVMGLKRMVAITSQDNELSSRLLKRLGFKFERMINLSNGDHDDMLFASEA